MKPVQKFQPLTVARQRESTLQRITKLRKTHNATKAAALCGVSVATAWRWQKRFAGRGLHGLMPKPAAGGRHGPFTKLHLPISAGREIERLTIEHGSRRAALLQFAHSPSCPLVLARYIARTGHMPTRLERVGRLNRVAATVFGSLDGLRLFVKVTSAARCSASDALFYSTPASRRRQPK